LTTQDSVSVETCSSVPIDGSAMFMIDASRTTTNWATASSAKARHRRGSRLCFVEVIMVIGYNRV
jgi:hypothetical protein